MESKLGRNRSAFDRIAGLHDKVLRLANRYLASEYYETYARVQADAGNAKEAEEGLQNAVNIAEQELASLHSERERLNWAKQMGDVYNELVEVRLNQSNYWGALEILESYRSAALRTAISTPDMSRASQSDALVPNSKAARAVEHGHVAAAMNGDSNATVLVYALLPHGITIWVSDGRDIFVKRVDVNSDSFRRLAERFENLCSTPRSPLGALHSIARQTYAILISPIAEHLQNHRPVVIDAPGPTLNRIPFQALMDIDGSFFVENHSIVYFPGIISPIKLRKASALGVSTRPLIVGNSSPDVNTGLSPLAGAGEEAKEIAQLLPASRLLIGNNATLIAVKSELPNATLFHFAGHSDRRDATVGLLLRNVNQKVSSMLDSSVLEGLNLSKLELAVLSSCNTENGTEGAPQDWESLTRAFLQAGVPHVVASRWSVDSDSTRILMRLFYTSLVAGNDVGQALSAAESQLCHHADTEHPYYWAGFDAFGKN